MAAARPRTRIEGLGVASPGTLDIDEEFARIVNALTRRGLLAGGLGTAALLGLSACGLDQPHDTSDVSTPATRKVDSVNGPISVPAHPKRVVTLDGFSMAAMFDLGLTPAGVYSAGEQYVEPQFLAEPTRSRRSPAAPSAARSTWRRSPRYAPT